MVSIGGFTSSLYAAARSYDSASRAEARVGNQIARQGPDFRTNSVNAALTRNLQSTQVGWNNSARVNQTSLDRFDAGYAVTQAMIDLELQQLSLLQQASDTSLDQTSRDTLGQNIESLSKQSVSMLTDYRTGRSYGSQILLDNIDEGVFSASNGQVIVHDFGPNSAKSYDYIEMSGMTMYYTQGVGASTYSSNAATLQHVIDAQNAGIFETDPTIIPKGYTRKISDFGTGVAIKGVEIARDFANKMSDTIDISIERLNAIDYETQSHYLAQAQAQKTMAMSAMNIANQAQQAYVQTLQYARQNVGQLVNFYG